MKKYYFLIVLSLFAIIAKAQNGRIDLRQQTRAEITQSDFTHLRAVFSYGSIESIYIATERGTFSEIAIEGTYASGEIGAPELPVSHQLLAVPFGAIPRVNVINYTTTDYRLSDYGIGTILPHQPSVRKDQNLDEVQFVYNAAAYQTRNLATAPEVSIEIQGTMRGIRIGSLVINPVSYNPTNNTLRVFNNIEVEVFFDGADHAETERMLLNTYSPYFDIVYKQMFNYRQILDVYTDHPDLMAYPVHMIVVAPENYVSTLQPWINWKVQKGFDVNVVTTSQAGNNYSAIRSYIQSLYNTGVSQGATPTFLILVGDVAQVPNATGSSTQKVTDLYYGSVDGDYFPDMFYSRMSAENTTQLTNIVNKILQYEQYTMPDPSYLNNVTLIAGWDNYWNAYIGRPTINYATTYYYNTAHGFNQVNTYLQQGQYTGCYNTLNTGVGFINYTAHGSETSWSDPQFTVSNVNALTNTNKYFLAMGNCCLTGNFGYSQPCFGEAMLRGENKAAYSYIGSCPVTYWYEDYYFGVGATNVYNQTPSLTNTATGVYDGIWMDDTYNTVSSITFLGNIAVCYAHTGNYTTSASPTYYWQAYHVLGDGSIMPYRVNPTANTVNHATSISASATSFTVSAEAGSYVGISQNNVLKGAALVPAGGSVDVPVSGIGSGQVHIVVTKPQRQPYIQDISVSGGGGTTYTVNVSASPTNGGTVTGGGTYNQGASCTVSATANSGYTFTNWTENGNVVSTNASYTFSVTANRTLVANFTAQYTITVTPNPVAGGNVSINGRSDREVITYDFEADFTAQEILDWTIIDADGDGLCWYIRPTGLESLGHNNSQGFVTSASYQNVALTPDNYLVSPQGQYSSISFWACAQDAAWPQEHFGVAVSTTNNTSASAFTTIQEWTMAAKATRSNQERGTNELGTYYEYTVDLSAYAGQNIYVAIHHFNCTDWFRLNVDDITLTTGSGGGSTSAVFDQGASCTVTATANSGYSFVNWTENGAQVSTNANYTFTVTGNRNLIANFQAQTQQYTVSVSANPSNGGSVTGGGSYNQGASCTVTATANSGYNFVNWTENGTQVSTNANYAFTVTGNRNLVANFQAQPQQYTISVSANPTNGGNVTGEGTFTEGSSCTVSATASSGFDFVNWTENGTQVSANANYTFTITGNRNLVANFQAQPQQYTISVSANPNYGGNVSGGGTFTEGQSCTVYASPNAGYTFVNWTENGTQVSTDFNYTFTVTANRSLVANFQSMSYAISVSADPSAGGTVSGGGTYDFNTECTVSATPNEGYTFVNWTENGTQVSANANYTFIVTSSRNLVAHFTTQGYVITAIASPANGGVVTGSGGYNYGQTCTLTATPNSGYSFQKWTKNGTQVSTNPTYSFTVTESATYTAHFIAQSYTITVAANPNNAGNVSGGGSFIYGQTCTVTASANSGYAFANWTENGTQVSSNASYSFTVTGNRNLVANFSQNTYTIQASAGENGSITPSGAVTVTQGANQSFSMVPASGYEILDVLVDGNSIGTMASYTFTNVTANHSIHVTFVRIDGVEENNAISPVVYPNPTLGEVIVECYGLSHIRIVNVYGQTVYDTKIEGDQVRIDLSHMAEGIYLMHIEANGGQAIKKIVVE